MPKSHINKKMTLGKRLKVIRSATSFRSKLFGVNEAIDPEALLDRLYDHIPNYDWFVGDNFFESMNDVIAYAKFNDGRHLFMRDWIYDALVAKGSTEYKQALFVIAHEIGHLLLHFKSGKSFARNINGSIENLRSDKIQEMEANLFAGALIVPIESIDHNLSPQTISRLYGASFTVSKICLKEAGFVKLSSNKR